MPRIANRRVRSACSNPAICVRVGTERCIGGTHLIPDYELNILYGVLLRQGRDQQEDSESPLTKCAHAICKVILKVRQATRYA